MVEHYFGLCIDDRTKTAGTVMVESYFALCIDDRTKQQLP